MIITISGTPGSGKSTAAKLVARKLNFTHYSVGGLMREMAAKQNMSINEFSKLAEGDPEIDSALDERQAELGKKRDNFVIDGRLSFHFIPHSVKIHLDADIRERAKRIIADRHRKEDNKDIEKAIANMKEREASEKKRYKDYYNLTVNKKNFDLSLDTTHLSKEEVLNRILEFLEKK